MKIPFVSFEETNRDIRSEAVAEFEKFFDSHWYILGDRVKLFETAYAGFNNVGYCIGTSNGLDALHLCLKALNIGPGDEVIIPSNTYIATALAVSYVGATPVFVEPDIETYNLDATKIAASITSKTRAIMPVHLYGQCCQMDEVMKIARDHELFVVEDNAQAQGSYCNNQLAGTFGDVNGTSFYPGKNLGALGDAGAVTTNSPSLARKISMLRNYGSEKKYHHEIIGFNMRLDEVQAGLLQLKLKYLPKWTKQRQEIAGWYYDHLSDINELILPKVANGCTHVYHVFNIRTSDRDKLQEHLHEDGIGTLIHYPIPVHLQKAYVDLGHKEGDFPIAEEISKTCLSLPVWPGMTEVSVKTVAASIRSFFQK